MVYQVSHLCVGTVDVGFVVETQEVDGQYFGQAALIQVVKRVFQDAAVVFCGAETEEIAPLGKTRQVSQRGFEPGICAGGVHIAGHNRAPASFG